MSFGFSIGDFLTVIKLIADIATSLRDVQGGSSSEYQELIRELESLQKALNHVDKLTGKSEQQPAITAIKCAALMCQHPLTEFYNKIQKYEGSLGSGKSKNKLKEWKHKAEWGLTKKEEVAKLRGYLNAHVGSLNMLLLAHGLDMVNFAFDQATEEHEDVQMRLGVVQRNVQDQGVLLQRNASTLAQVFRLLSGEVIPQLKSLVELATKVWKSNVQIYRIILRSQTSLPFPDIRHTWYQDPVKFEDALGRIIPIPSEYDYAKVSAIIREQFKTGPGRRKVLSQEYELFSVQNSGKQITERAWTGFLPGAHIKMAVTMQFPFSDQEACPVLHCGSQTYEKAPGGGNICSKCKVWFSTTKRKRIEAPFYSKEAHKRVKLIAEELLLEPTHIAKGIEEPRDENSDSEIEDFRNIRVKQNTIYRGQLLEEYIKDYRRLPKKCQMMFRKRLERALFERGYRSRQVNYALMLGPLSRSTLERHQSRYPTAFEETEEVEAPYLVQDTPIKVHRKHAEPDILDSFNIGWEEDASDPDYIWVSHLRVNPSQNTAFERNRQALVTKLLGHAVRSSGDDDDDDNDDDDNTSVCMMLAKTPENAFLTEF